MPQFENHGEAVFLQHAYSQFNLSNICFLSLYKTLNKTHTHKYILICRKNKQTGQSHVQVMLNQLLRIWIFFNSNQKKSEHLSWLWVRYTLTIFTLQNLRVIATDTVWRFFTQTVFRQKANTLSKLKPFVWKHHLWLTSDCKKEIRRRGVRYFKLLKMSYFCISCFETWISDKNDC